MAVNFFYYSKMVQESVAISGHQKNLSGTYSHPDIHSKTYVWAEKKLPRQNVM